MTYSESTFSLIYWSMVVLNIEHDPTVIWKLSYDKKKIILESITKKKEILWHIPDVKTSRSAKNYAVLQW